MTWLRYGASHVEAALARALARREKDRRVRAGLHNTWAPGHRVERAVMAVLYRRMLDRRRRYGR